MKPLASHSLSLSSLLRRLSSWRQSLSLVSTHPDRANAGTTVAVLIDGENTLPSVVASTLVHARMLGEIAVGRVYGNWSSSIMNQWSSTTVQFGLEQQHHGHAVAGKNATDIQLSIDAVDLLTSGHHFCPVAHDSDYVPLVWRLRRAGRKVMVVGGKSTALALQQACTVFVPLEPPVPVNMPAHLDLQQQSRDGTNTPLSTLLREAYISISPGGEWVSSSQMGAVLGRRQPSFTPKTYGHKNLSSLLLASTDLFETRTQSVKGGHLQVEVRLRHHKHHP